jgi:hypothetical protein
VGSCITLLGCSAASGASIRSTSTDSASVRVIREAGKDRILEAEFSRDLVLGGKAEGPESFYRLRPAQLAVSPDGRLIVLDGDNHRVHVFDPSGAHVASLGRAGQGPGEFVYPAAVAGLAEGQLGVFDFGKGQVVRFAPDGVALPQTSLPLPFDGAGMTHVSGGLLFGARGARGGVPAVRRLVHTGVGGTVSLASVETAPPRHVRYESCGVSLTQPPLFTPEILWSSNGSRTAAVSGDGYSVQVFDGLKLVAEIRREIVATEVTEKLARRRLGEGQWMNVGGRECLIPTDEILRARGFAPRLPVLEGVSVSPSGAIWVRRAGVGGQPSQIDVFSPSGEYQGTLEPDAPFPHRFLGDGRLVTIEKDELDVDRVVLYTSDLPPYLTSQ